MADSQFTASVRSFDEAISTLTPHFLKLPQAHLGMITQMCRDYIRACELAALELDMALLTPVATVLN